MKRWMRATTAAMIAMGTVAAQSSPTTLTGHELFPSSNRGGSMERKLQTGLPGRWWKQPATVAKLGLTVEQQNKMDDIFLQSRLKLIDLNAALEKEEALLEPMVLDKLDEPKVRAQIDRIAQARAELEKANAYLLLGLRMVLSPEQWKTLREPAHLKYPLPGQWQKFK
jgi:Spy/CpxP family protein refolding chaperone